MAAQDQAARDQAGPEQAGPDQAARDQAAPGGKAPRGSLPAGPLPGGSQSDCPESDRTPSDHAPSDHPPSDRALSDRPVRHRRVFFVPGYDPHPPRRYRELYRREAAAQAAIAGHKIEVSRDGRDGWRVEAEIEGQRVITRIEVLAWNDIVRDSLQQPIALIYLRMLHTLWRFAASGTLLALFRLRAAPMIAGLAPVGFMLVYLLAAGLAAWAAYALGRGLGAPVWAGCLAAGAAFWAVMAATRRLEPVLFTYYLVSDFAHVASAMGAWPGPLAARMAGFCDRIAAAQTAARPAPPAPAFPELASMGPASLGSASMEAIPPASPEPAATGPVSPPSSPDSGGAGSSGSDPFSPSPAGHNSDGPSPGRPNPDGNPPNSADPTDTADPADSASQPDTADPAALASPAASEDLPDATNRPDPADMPDPGDMPEPSDMPDPGDMQEPGDRPEPADEVLVIGHSSGAQIAVALVAEAVRRAGSSSAEAPGRTGISSAEAPSRAGDAPRRNAAASDAPARDTPARRDPVSDAPARGDPVRGALGSDAPRDDPLRGDLGSDDPVRDGLGSDAPTRDDPVRDGLGSDAPASHDPPRHARQGGGRTEDGQPGRRAVLALLTLGQSVPMTSFLPAAHTLRRDLRSLAAGPVPWLDVSAPADGAAFALCDPVAVSGVAPPDQRWPLVISAAFRNSLSPARLRTLRWRYFRRHIQYLCAFDRPADYDYFAITAGPQHLADRIAGRGHSPSRIVAIHAPHRSIAA